MKPLTRKEMLLDGAAKGNLDDFKPATREEVFAKRALANAGGSGGGETILYGTDGNSYLYKDNNYSEKVSAKELDTIMNAGRVKVVYAISDEDAYHLYPLSYTYSEEWGSRLYLMYGMSSGDYFHLWTSEYAEES